MNTTFQPIMTKYIERLCLDPKRLKLEPLDDVRKMDVLKAKFGLVGLRRTFDTKSFVDESGRRRSNWVTICPITA